MSDESEFTLANAPPKRKPAEFAKEPIRQTVLFAGLDALPGQRDLFATDGEPEKDPPASA